MKIPKGYHRSTQGWPNKKEALKAAKRMRDIGYKARVAYDAPWWKILWAE